MMMTTTSTTSNKPILESLGEYLRGDLSLKKRNSVILHPGALVETHRTCGYYFDQTNEHPSLNRMIFPGTGYGPHVVNISIGTRMFVLGSPELVRMQTKWKSEGRPRDKDEFQTWLNLGFFYPDIEDEVYVELHIAQLFRSLPLPWDSIFSLVKGE